ncbi:DUF1376 domain-containing protein [Lentisphaerota bacterium WC36G]|nr:YdaU family protein [Lentisphaerae bacterium WC36]
MANNLHTMPLKIEKLLSSRKVRNMKLDEFGAYLKLLSEAWLDGAMLPNNDNKLRYDFLNIEDDETWKRIKKFVVNRMFKPSEDGKFLVNQHQVEIYNEVVDKHNKRVNAGKKSGESRRKNKQKCKTKTATTTAKKAKTKEVKLTVSGLSINFKKWTLDEFQKDVDFHSDKYSQQMQTNFINYWTERDKNGKMKFQKNETWETAKRLATWNNRGFNNQNNFSTKSCEVEITNDNSPLAAIGG